MGDILLSCEELSFKNITNKYFAVHRINVIFNSFIYLKVSQHFDEHTNITILVRKSESTVKSPCIYVYIYIFRVFMQP